MKILYANPIFLDYRIPYYKRLIELFDNNFYVMYSPLRYKDRYDTLLKKIPLHLGQNAIEYKDEKLYDVATHSFKKYTVGSKHIPYPHNLYKTIKKIKPDIIISEGFFQWTPWIIVYTLLFKCKLFIGYERTCHTERNANWLQIWDRKISNWFVDGYLVNGIETKKYLESLNISPNKIHIGGMNADSEGLRLSIKGFPSKERFIFHQRFKRNEDGLIFLFTGMMIKRKGVDHLLIAWKEHIKKYPNDSLILVGNGDLLDLLKKQYSDNTSVYFEGRVEYDNIYKYYAIADVYILPTIEDNWSLVIPEAMSCGLPVATSIYNGCHSELIKDGINGFTFDTFKHETIISTLEKFHHVDLKQFGKASIELEKPFNTENCAKRTYNEILKTIKNEK